MSAVGGAGRRTRKGREEYSKGSFVDSVSVQAVETSTAVETKYRGFPKISESLDRFCRIKLDVTRNKNYVDV